MTDQEVLQAVIEKAVKNGYETYWYRDGRFTFDEMSGYIWDFNEGIWEMIFSHRFAMALWGEEEYVVCEYVSDLNGNSNGNSKLPYKSASHEGVYIPCYQYHLQQLVLAENRIEYLKQFI